MEDLNHNLQIEEIVAQDDEEVVFRAIEQASGKAVMLRRFFPFGRGGRGLRDDERLAFEAVIQRLRGVDHPALCPVLAGGVDPVDGIPFVAVEWTDGVSLEERLRQGCLPPALVFTLLDVLLEVAAVLSQALGRDGLWVEMLDSSILWVDRGAGSLPVFRIAPLCCLWTGNDWQVPMVLAGSTEAVLGWQGERVSDRDGDGLGAWVKWLRAHPAASIAEVRGALAAATGRKVPGPPPGFNNQSARPAAKMLREPRRPPKLSRVLTVVCLILATAGGGWWALRQHQQQSGLARTVHPPAPATGQTPPAPVVPPGTDSGGQTPAPDAVAGFPELLPSSRRLNQPPTADGEGRVFGVDEVDALMARIHNEVTMEGDLVRVALSDDHKFWYLEFSRIQLPDTARAFMPVVGDDPAVDFKQVLPLIGKRIRVRGMVDGELVGPQQVRRPKVLMSGRDALELVD